MSDHLTLDELRSAVDDLAGALIDHQPLTDQQWDQAIATLLTGREQHGGRIRRLIQTILNVGHDTAPAGLLPAALSELHCHLALADNPPPADAHRGTETASSRQRRRPRRPVQHTQLRLFDSDSQP